MLRPARFADAMRITDLLVEAQASSRFAGIVDVDVAYTRKLIAASIQRDGGSHDGGTHCRVFEGPGAKVEAFMIGVLDRVYGIGTHLVANDQFLVASPRAPRNAMLALVRSYLAWADRNPKVIETWLSWTDVMPTGERMGGYYEKMGFQRCGAMFRRSHLIEERQAA
jgi:GNAT superfamily N-acetyltransferase